MHGYLRWVSPLSLMFLGSLGFVGCGVRDTRSEVDVGSDGGPAVDGGMDGGPSIIDGDTDSGRPGFDAGPPMPCETPGATESVACGWCGTVDRFCTVDGAWSYGACVGEGVCMPGTSGNLTCGMCGEQSNRCNELCEWVSSGKCTGEGVCTPGQTETTSDGCPAGQTRQVECDASCGYTIELEACSAPAGCTKIDVLFVIDDSGSMAQEQPALVAAMPEFVRQLDAYRSAGGLPIDYRIGMTTTGRDFTVVTNVSGLLISDENHGPNGALLENPTCSMTRPWIERSDARASESIACLANVGTTGSSYSMPLLVTERALTDRVTDGSNAGFLRPDALLSVVMVTDADDCSRTESSVMAYYGDDICDPSALIPTGRLITTLDRVKGRERWSVSVIAGPGPGACADATGGAADAVRLRAFGRGAVMNTSFPSICMVDLAPPLELALELIDAACVGYR